MENTLAGKVNFLMGYSIISTLGFTILLLSSFNKAGENKTIDELTVKRINVVSEDGSLRMVISNENRQHPGRMDGKDLPARSRPPGIIFFNTDGDECGGLVADVSRKDSTINSGMSFTMDNYRNDQVVQIKNDETYKNGKAVISRGLVVNEFPAGADMTSFMKKWDALQAITDPAERKEKESRLRKTESAKRTLFLGLGNSHENGLFLYDSSGNPKIKIYVDAEGNPKFESFGKDGSQIDLLPGSK